MVWRAWWAVATEVTKLLREKLKTPLSPTQEDSYSMLFPKAVTDLTDSNHDNVRTKKIAVTKITFFQPKFLHRLHH